jgi:hypothetical protein
MSRLTPPTFPIFLISLVLAIVAIVSVFYHIPRIGAKVDSHRFWIMAVAYVILAAGVIFRGL